MELKELSTRANYPKLLGQIAQNYQQGQVIERTARVDEYPKRMRASWM